MHDILLTSLLIRVLPVPLWIKSKSAPTSKGHTVEEDERTEER